MGSVGAELWLCSDGYMGEDTGMLYPGTEAALVLLLVE